MLNVVAIPAFTDNYIWSLTAPQSSNCTVVDPGDANAVIAFLEHHDYHLTDILITHHHPDHIGGLKELMARFPEVNVYAPAHADLPKGVHLVADGSSVELPDLKATFAVIATPGHTLDHICYYTEGHLFSGDTLFAGGCGRLFEGTAEQMYHSLNKLAELPLQTQVYCAHEYTLANLTFALTLEPNNPQLQRRIASVKQLRNENKITLPTTLLLEQQTNPFMRCDKIDFREALHQSTGEKCVSGVQAFAIARRLKDQF